MPPSLNVPIIIYVLGAIVNTQAYTGCTVEPYIQYMYIHSHIQHIQHKWKAACSMCILTPLP